MHIPENYLSPATCAVMMTAMVPVWGRAVHKIRTELSEDKMPMLGVGAAFSFLAMMFNVPLVGGTTGHAVGGTLIAILFGPNAACIAVSIALLIQAVIFGDGGILAFGANCFNMAFVLPYVGYFVYRALKDTLGKASGAGDAFAAAIGSYVGMNAAALCAAIEFGIQPMLFTDEAGLALYGPYPLSVSIPAMMIPHLLVAGIVEAVFTVFVYEFVKRTSPQLIFDAPAQTKRHSLIPVFALVTVLIAATPLGLLATGTAWGEWGADEIAEIETNGKALGYTPQGLANGWELSVPLPDYAAEGLGEVFAYILSAVIGVSLLVIFFKLLSYPLKARRRA